MAKKSLKKEIKKFEKGLEDELEQAEKWMKERRKFFIKLIWVVGFIAVLLIVSNLYLKINGVGV